MLKSSGEYLNALREGNYLLFLEWPRFVVEHYNPTNSFAQNGDELIELLAFEWLCHGYLEGDAKRVALLYKLHEAEPKILPADLDYALVCITITLFQCMIYQNTKVHSKFFGQEKKTKKEIIAVMNAHSIEPAHFETSLKEQQTQFKEWVGLVTDSQLNLLIGHIEAILKLRNSINNYLDELEKISTEPEPLRGSRISVVKRLAQYLQEQTKLTEEVQLEINTYIAKIRELGPSEWEENYIVTITPVSLTRRALQAMAKVGKLLFQAIPSEEPTLAEKPAGLTQKPQSLC